MMMTCSVAANYMRLSAGYRYIGSEEEKKAKKKKQQITDNGDVDRTLAYRWIDKLRIQISRNRCWL